MSDEIESYGTSIVSGIRVPMSLLIHSFGSESAPPIVPSALISPLLAYVPSDLTCIYITGNPFFELTGGVTSIKGLTGCHYVASR